MDNPYLQQLKLEKLAAQVIPITAQLDKRQTHALSEVAAPTKTRRIWTGLDSSSSSEESETEARKRAAALVEKPAKKRAEILPPPSILSNPIDLGKAIRRTAELDAFEAQLPLSVREEYEKRVEQRIADERRRVERKCRRQMRQFNRRGVFDKDVNTARIKTKLHVEYSKKADAKLIRTSVLNDMLEEHKWKRTHGQKVEEVESRLDAVLKGTALQAVTTQGKKALLEREDLVPQVISGIARRIRRMSQELSQREAQAISSALKDPTLGPSKSQPLKLAPLMKPPSRGSSRPSLAEHGTGRSLSIGGGGSARRSSRVSAPRSPPTAPLGSPGGSATVGALPFSFPPRHHDADSEQDTLSDLASPKGATREDLRVSRKGKKIGAPTVNPATRSQPVFIQHLQGVTAGVQEETRHWALQSGVHPEEASVAANVARPTVAAVTTERPRSSSGLGGDPLGDITSTVMLRPHDSLAARIPDEANEFTEVLLGDRSGVHMSKSGGSQDRSSHRNKEIMAFHDYRSHVLRRPTMQDEVHAQLQRLRESTASLRIDGDIPLEGYATASLSTVMFPESLRTRALGRATHVELMSAKPGQQIGMFGTTAASTAKLPGVGAAGTKSAPSLTSTTAPSMFKGPGIPPEGSPLFRFSPTKTAQPPHSPMAASRPGSPEATETPASPQQSPSPGPKSEPDRLQTMMNDMWNTAEMPAGQRLDFLLKYSQPENGAKLPDVVALWSEALEGVLMCERVKAAVKKVKQVAHDPHRGSRRPGDSPSKAVFHDVPRFTSIEIAYLKNIKCYVAPSVEAEGVPAGMREFDEVLSSSRTQFEEVFALLRDYVGGLADKLYDKYGDVLTYRGVDYGTLLASPSAITATVEYADPVMRQVSHLLK